MSGEIELTAGYTFTANEVITVAKLRAAVEGIVARIAAGAITAAELADGSIGLDKLAEDVLTSVILPDGAVTTAKLATGAVTTAKLAAAAVDRTKIAANVAGTAMTQNVDGSLSPVVDDVSLAIVDGELRVKLLGISASHIADFAVTREKIAFGAVTADKIDTEAVTAAKIAASAVTAGKLASSALGQVAASDSGMALELTASSEESWKSWTVTPRTAGSVFVVLIAAAVTYAGSAPMVTCKLYDDASEETSAAVQAVASGEQLVTMLFCAPGSTGARTLAVKVTASQDCDIESTSRIVWMEWPSK
jgi:hypothetical protein